MIVTESKVPLTLVLNNTSVSGTTIHEFRILHFLVKALNLVKCFG